MGAKIPWLYLKRLTKQSYGLGMLTKLRAQDTQEMQGPEIGRLFIEDLAIEKISLVQKAFLVNLKSLLELSPGRAFPYRHCAPLHEINPSLASD